MNVKDLKIEVGTKIKLYVSRAKDGSGSSMGRGVAGKPENLIEVIYGGPVYNGVMGRVCFLDGDPLGLPISADDILEANPQYKK